MQNLKWLFQDYQLTLNTSSPQFTECFRKSVVTWFPPAFLFIVSLGYLPYLLNLPKEWTIKTGLNRTKMVRILYGCRSLQWRHNGFVSNHQPHHCLLSRLFGCRSKKTSKLCVTGLCAGNSPETGEFPAQMASNAENVPIWWRHHVITNRIIPMYLKVLMMMCYRWCVIVDGSTTFSDHFYQGC